LGNRVARRRLEFDEEIENLVQDFVRTRVFPVDLVMTTTGFSLFSIALAQNKARLCLWPIVRNRQQAARRPPFS